MWYILEFNVTAALARASDEADLADVSCLDNKAPDIRRARLMQNQLRCLLWEAFEVDPWYHRSSAGRNII